MSDPQDNYDILAGCSRVDEAATVTSTLLNLPSELILRIASLLEIGDLLAVRRVRFELDRLKPPQAYQAQTDPRVHIQHYSGQTPLERIVSWPPPTTITDFEIPSLG